MSNLIGEFKKNQLKEYKDDYNAKIIYLWLREKSLNTQKSYEVDIMQFIEFIDNKKLNQVVFEELQDYRDFLFERYCDANNEEERNQAIIDGKTATVARKFSAVKSLFAFANFAGFLQVNPASAIKSPVVRYDFGDKVLSKEEISIILGHIKNREYRYRGQKQRDYALVRLLYASAARISEVVQLKWKDIRFNSNNSGVINFWGKGAKERYVKISRPTYNAIIECKKDSSLPDDYIFISRQKKKVSKRRTHISRHQAWNIIKKLAKEANIEENKAQKVSCHWFRHSNLSHAIANGCDLAVARDTAGHASIATTNKYIKSNPEKSTNDWLFV